MTNITKKAFYVFFIPLLGFWPLLIAIYLGKDFEESFIFNYIIKIILNVEN